MIEFDVDIIQGISVCAGFEFVEDEDVAWVAMLDLFFFRFMLVGWKQA